LRSIPLWLALALAFAAVPAAAADTYPARPIRMIVPFPPGGSSDVMARLIAQRLGEALGQSVIVDSRPGAGGNLGSEIAARAQPDGHTLVMGTVATVTINPFLYQLNYDPAKDLVPLSTVAIAFQVLLAHPSTNLGSVADLIRVAKDKPGTLTAGSASSGTTGHLSLELLKQLAGIDIVHVPFRGAGPAQVAVLGGQVQILFDSVTTAVPHVQSGRVRALGVTSRTRSALLPTVPAINETIPGFETTGWFALLAPAGTPADIRARLAKEITAVLNNEEVRARIIGVGAEPMILTGPALDRYLADERVKWGRVIKQANIKAD